MTVITIGSGGRLGAHPWVGDAEFGFHYLGRALLDAPPVDTGHWQGLKDVPQTKTRELRLVTYNVTVPDSAQELARFVKPSDPWAELQFQERVAGEPLNPGETYKQWPWYKGNVEPHRAKAQGKFSHTYMERYWPRRAGGGEYHEGLDGDGGAYGGYRNHRGIRYRYGDLDDVVALLAHEPHTRQAYLPVWFPEDTGATSNQRVPCSLGYHFMLREGRLHCLYTIRSCDFLRHFRDDVYLTARLVQWMLDKLRLVAAQDNDADDFWQAVTPGTLTMVIHSLHIFEGDLPKMRREYGDVASSSTD